MQTIEIKETKLKSSRINQKRFKKEASKIFDLEVKSPKIRTYSYTYNNVKLAKSYLKDYREYLCNLN